MANIIKSFERWKEIITLAIFIRLSLLLYASLVNKTYLDIFTPWVRWDGPHYIEIAKNWYQTIGESSLFIVFYPMYPLLIKLTSFLVNHLNTSAILVSIFFSILASVALYELVLLDFSRRVAFISVWFLNIFPTAYFLQASYTESLFLFLTIATVYFFRKDEFLKSGIAGLFSTLTRINGLLLLPLLILEAKNIKKTLSTLFITPIGFLIYLFINYITFGEFFYFSKPLQSNWFKQPAPPYQGINNILGQVQNPKDPNFFIYASELIAIIFLIIMTLVVFFKVRKSYGIYMLLNLLLFTSTSFILSTPRYTMSLFPIYIVFSLIKNKVLLTLVSLISIYMLVKLTIVYTSGGWAY